MLSLSHLIPPLPRTHIYTGTEKFFKKQFGPALASSVVGYMGGQVKNPTYEQVCTGNTNHAEVLQLSYYPNQVKYGDLVEFFYRMCDYTLCYPTSLGGVHCTRCFCSV